MSSYIEGTFTADGESSEIVIERRGMAFIGSTSGQDFDGGAVTVQLKAPNGVWYPSLNTTDQANVLSIDVALATPIRLSLSGATTADLDYVLETDLNYVATMPDAS